MATLVIAATTIVLLVLALGLGVGRPITYRINEQAVVVLVLKRFVVFSVPFVDIEDVAVQGRFVAPGTFFPLLWLSRFATKVVAVTYRRGLFRVVLFSPADPDDFARELRVAIRRSAR